MSMPGAAAAAARSREMLFFDAIIKREYIRI
jgi:hypothetical protein